MKETDKNDLLIRQALFSKIEIQQRLLETYSKEIYDNIGQVLSLAKLQLSDLASVRNKKSKAIRESGKLVGKAIADLRNLARQLTPDEIVQKGFAAAFITELKRLSAAGLCQVSYSARGNNLKLEEEKELVVFCVLRQIIHPVLSLDKPGFIHVEIQNTKTRSVVEIETGSGKESLFLNTAEISDRLKAVNCSVMAKGLKKTILKIIINK